MSTSERFNGPNYLTTSRLDFERLALVVNEEAVAIHAQVESGEAISPVEWSMVAAGVDDIDLWSRIYTWANGFSIPFDPAQMVKDHVYNRKQSYRAMKGLYKHLLKANREELSGPGRVEAVLGDLATLGTTQIDTVRYSDWKVTHFELWARIAPQIANLPVAHSFLTHRERPRKGPKEGVVFEAMTRAAQSSFVLRAIQAAILEKTDPDSPFGRKIQSLEGIIAELDGLIFLNETSQNFESSNVWHFPASPNMDICAENQQKCDLFTVEFSKDRSTMSLYYYDVKMRTYKSSARPICNGVNILGSNMMGNLLVNDGQIVRRAGVLSNDFIDENAEIMPATTENPADLLAHGFTGMHMDIGVMLKQVRRQKPANISISGS